MADEQLKITDAWEYFRNKSGLQIERRAFFAWVEQGYVVINDHTHDLTANQVNKTWHISRAKIDALIQALHA